MRVSGVLLVCAIVSMLVGVRPAAAQTPASLRGLVVDQSGGAIVGAQVTVRGQAGAVRVVSTDTAGEFSVSGLAAGRYDVEVQSPLFDVTRAVADVREGVAPALLRVALRVAGLSEALVVTGRRAEGRLSETPQRIEVVRREDIERSGALDLVDVLKRSVSVDVAQYNVLSGIGIRGFRPEPEGLNRRSLVLIDGRPAGSTNLAMLLLDNVERIEVQKGPSSALYGASAVGGVVNIITRQSRGAIGGNLSAGYGRFNTYELQGQAAGALGESAYFGVTAKRFDQQDDYAVGSRFRAPRAATGVRPFTAYDTTSATGKIGFDLSKHWTLESNGEFYRARDVLLPGSDTATAIGTSSATQGSKDIDRHSADVRLTGRFARVVPSLVVYGAHEGSDYTRVTSVAAADQAYLPFRYFAGELGYVGVQARADWAWSAWHSTVVGVDYDHVKSSSQSFLNIGTEVAAFSPDNIRATSGLFAKSTLRFRGGRSVLEAGARVDRIRATTLDSPLRPTFTGSGTTLAQLSPSGGIKHELAPGWRVHATAGKGFVVPDAGALTGRTVSSVAAANGTLTGATIVTGNPALRPETAVSWDMGVDWSGAAGRLDLTFFDTDVRDRIVGSVPNPNPNTALCPTSPTGQLLSCSFVTYANANASTMRGLELEAQWQVRAPLRVFLNTNYYLDRTDQLTTGNRDIYNVPQYTVRAGFDYIVRRVSGRVSARSVGRQKANDFTVPGFPEVVYPAFTVADVSVRYAVTERRQVELAVSNVLDTNYYENQGYTLPGRSALLRYRHGF